MIFPSRGIAITTSNVFHPSDEKNLEILDDLMLDIPGTEQEQMSLHLKKSQELIDLACEHIKRAKQLHDDLEAFYIDAMDFSKVDIIYKKIMREIN